MIRALTPLRSGGGALVLFAGPPQTAIRWSVDRGSVVSALEVTDDNGVATAQVSAEGLSAGETMTVRVEVYPNA